MKLIVKVLALVSTALTIILLAAEIFAVSRNFFPIKRWVDRDKTVIREHYLMPTNQWGVVMFGDRTKPYRSSYEEKGRLHGWQWTSSARFDGDNDGKYRVDHSSFADTAFSWGIAVTTAGAKEQLFYTLGTLGAQYAEFATSQCTYRTCSQTPDRGDQHQYPAFTL